MNQPFMCVHANIFAGMNARRSRLACCHILASDRCASMLVLHWSRGAEVRRSAAVDHVTIIISCRQSPSIHPCERLTPTQQGIETLPDHTPSRPLTWCRWHIVCGDLVAALGVVRQRYVVNFDRDCVLAAAERYLDLKRRNQIN